MNTQTLVSVTQAGSGDITPAAAHRSASLAAQKGEGAAVVEPAKLDDSPALPGSDVNVITGQTFIFSTGDSDPLGNGSAERRYHSFTVKPTRPLTMPLPPEMQRCMAHGLYQGDTCYLADNCGRYVTISHDSAEIRPMYRACDSDLMSAYIPMEGYPDRDEMQS